jgi:hypothetical protein
VRSQAALLPGRGGDPAHCEAGHLTPGRTLVVSLRPGRFMPLGGRVFYEHVRRCIIPKGSKVEKVYKALVKEGKSKASAAKIAQSTTGQALSTGKKPKSKSKKKS